MLLETLRKESLALTRKDLTGSCHGKGRAPPSRDVGRTKTSAPMKHKAPMEILPVEMIWRTTTFLNFPVYLILLLLLVLLRQILLQCFKCLFKPKGASTFLQMYVLIFWFFKKIRRTFRLNYVLLLKILKVQKWTNPLEGEKILKSKSGQTP